MIGPLLALASFAALLAAGAWQRERLVRRLTAELAEMFDRLAATYRDVTSAARRTSVASSQFADRQRGT